MTEILDHNGLPFVKTDRAKKKAADFLMGRLSDYVTSLGVSRMPASYRASMPFETHAWVYAAAMTSAVVASQAPFAIFRETEETIKLRKKNNPLSVRSGRNRRAVQRHLQIPLLKRLMNKGIEIQYDHPLYDVFLRPNPYQDGTQFFQLTHLWLQIRGEVFWVMTMEDGSPVPPGKLPEVIYPMSPDIFKPILEYGSRGTLIGWEVNLPKYFPSKFIRVVLTLDQVIQFKFPNPSNPIRGMSKLSAVAMGIETDLLIQTQNRTLIENESVPRGLLTHPDSMEVEDEKAFKKKFEQMYGGVDNAGRTATLTGGFQYIPLSLTPAEARYIEQQGWDREEILAVMSMPKSCLGVTEHLNYATQLGQDKNLWDKNILPMLQLEEVAIDSGMFHAQDDTTYGAFDIRNVEALRAGIVDKVNIAKSMSESVLHVPPRVSFEVVGLEVPEYEGDEEVLVNALGATPLSSVLSGDHKPEQPEPSALSLKAKKPNRHAQFIKLETVSENIFKDSYRSWIGTEKKLALAKFDEATNAVKSLRTTKANLNINAILVDLKEMQARLKTKTRPIYAGTLESTYQFTVDDLGGVAIFEMDDPKLLQYFDKKMTKFLGATPKTVNTNLQQSLLEGIKNGETIQHMRQRVSEVFDIASSSAKALSVARTETATFMNGVRDVMFELGGVNEEIWSTSEDEHVRDTHVLYGEEEPHPRDFNYLDVSGSSGGTLSYPGDLRCTIAAEIINCRCIKVPVS